MTRVGPWDPIPDTRRLVGLDRRTELVGIDLRDDAQVELLDQITTMRDEYDRLADWYDLKNNMYGPVDSETYYAMIRLRRPHQIVEIGSGNSTKVAARAIAENGYGKIVCIDPEPRADVTGLPVDWRRTRVEDVDVSLFQGLSAGDIVFIDSSHVLRTGGDVAFEFLEIVPRLASGVIVHVHDIFLPAEYPASWLLNDRMFPTEQYLLQAFLAYNSEFRVVWSARHMVLNHEDLLYKAFSSFRTAGDPSSFWFERC